ncbi:MAG: pseudouridine synthase [Burkholderiales bacterium]|nr:pseudouridine synthase [Burkholderiales bacterium]
MTLILFNKPYGVVSQFSAHDGRPSLADFLDIPNVYPAGRLDADSEGLMLLTDDGTLQHDISNPVSEKSKTYLVQTEGLAHPSQLAQLRAPMRLPHFTTLGSKAVRIEPPGWLWPRDPPIRQRRELPTDWLSITLTEGKNRQVRRMTAAVGLPTLRLVRQAIGPISLATHPLMPGEWCTISADEWRGTKRGT